MTTEHFELDLPDGFEKAIQLTPEEMKVHTRLMAAFKMFQLGKISSGKAADLAGMTRGEFLETCGRYHVSVFNYPAEKIEDELQRDIQTLRNASGE
ncbi:MAG TPA: UPF0175 family protein [bacterium]|nr:UPF0175 family protein [bacterium]